MRIADDWVRLGLALVVIALVSLGMYSFSERAAVSSPFNGVSFVPRP